MAGERLQRFWTLARVNEPRASLTCDLIGAEHGLEVQCHDGAAVMKAERVASMADAMNLSEAWRATYRALGWNDPPE
jgi:hypothetical protein